MPRKSEKKQLAEQAQQQTPIPGSYQTPSPQQHQDAAPPGYSETPPSVLSSPNPRQPALTSTPGLLPLDPTQYMRPGASLSKDEKTITFSRPDLCSDVDALLSFLSAQAALPPRPQIRITGTNDTYGEGKIDFDIRVNLMRYLIPAPGQGHGQAPLNYVKVVEPNEPALRGHSTSSTVPHVDGGLKQWVWRFCRDKTASKAFILERTVPNWNTPLLEGCIRNLLASLNYQGRIAIAFPLTHSNVVVTNQVQNQGFFPRLFSLLAATKQYAVAQSVWPYANISSSSGAVGSDEGSGSSGSGGGRRRVCVVQSEEEWWDVWRDALAAAMVEGRKGWVTLEDVMDRVMSGKPPVQGKRTWGGSWS